MRWFLRLFGAFRAIESEAATLRTSLQEASTQNLILQDRMEALLSDRGNLWELVSKTMDRLDTSVSEERRAYQMQINQEWQKKGFGAPYPDAPTLPAVQQSTADPGKAVRSQMPSQRMAAAKSEFLEQVLTQQSV